MKKSLKAILQEGDDALGTTDHNRWLAVTGALTDAVGDLLDGVRFKGNNPLRAIALVRLAGLEIGRLAENEEHLYEGTEIFHAILQATAARTFAEREKDEFDAARAAIQGKTDRSTETIR